jgi:hypothetical protein
VTSPNDARLFGCLFTVTVSPGVPDEEVKARLIEAVDSITQHLSLNGLDLIQTQIRMIPGKEVQVGDGDPQA